MQLKDFLAATDYRITEGAEYYWNCYGPDAYDLTFTQKDESAYTSVVFDRKLQIVYEMTVSDDVENRHYRWTDPSVRNAHDDEAKNRGFNPAIAFDDVRWIDLELEEDILQKANAILNGRDYDSRVLIPIEVDDETLLTLFKAAHERDITLNQFVEEAVRDYVELIKPKDGSVDGWEYS